MSVDLVTASSPLEAIHRRHRSLKWCICSSSSSSGTQRSPSEHATLLDAADAGIIPSTPRHVNNNYRR